MSSGTRSPRPPWRGRRVVLGVTGGIAAYKAVQVARDLTLLGAEVDAVLTSGALHFVQPLSFEGVTGRPVRSDLFRMEGSALHLRLARDAQVVCVAPATADFIARAAHGRANDLLTALILATRAPVVVCPAMNHRMYEHPQTRANLRHLASDLAYEVAGPATGPLAHGEGEGPGRMLEPREIVEWVGRCLDRDSRFSGRTVLVTAGPTREPVDPVRFLGNRSSGRMGFAVARAAWRKGAEVVLVTGPTELSDPPGVEVLRVETAVEMERAVRERIPSADVAVFAAAVSDYRPARSADEKLKRAEVGGETTLELVLNPDVAEGTRELRHPGCVAVGFALETNDVLEHARAKLEAKGFDLLVANDATEEGAGFGVETNRVTFLSPDGEVEELPLLCKDEVAGRILDRVAPMLEERE